MKKQAILYSVVLMLSFSCVEPEQQAAVSDNQCDPGQSCDNNTVYDNDDGIDDIPPTDITPPVIVVEPTSSGVPLASKNYLQLNNTFSTLTGVATSDVSVLDEFNAIIMQLPTTSNPEALNGFNQIAQARLAFVYCDQYIEDNFNSYDGLTNDMAMRSMIDGFIDVDVNGNTFHGSLHQNLVAIMADTDNLVNDNNASRKKRKLLKMSCAALLASAYISMI